MPNKTAQNLIDELKSYKQNFSVHELETLRSLFIKEYQHRVDLNHLLPEHRPEVISQEEIISQTLEHTFGLNKNTLSLIKQKIQQALP